MESRFDDMAFTPCTPGAICGISSEYRNGAQPDPINELAASVTRAKRFTPTCVTQRFAIALKLI